MIVSLLREGVAKIGRVCCNLYALLGLHATETVMSAAGMVILGRLDRGDAIEQHICRQIYFSFKRYDVISVLDVLVPDSRPSEEWVGKVVNVSTGMICA